MNTDRRNDDELRDLLCAMEEGSLSPDGVARLDGLVRSDEQALRQYVEYMRMVSDLRFGADNGRAQGALARLFDVEAVGDECGIMKDECTANGRALPADAPPAIAPPIHPSSFIFRPFQVAPFAGGVLFCYLAAAFFAGAGVLAAWIWCSSRDGASVFVAWEDSLRNPANIVGKITRMVDCRWANPATAPASGTYVYVGRKFDLSAGELEITYSASAPARIVLRGPAAYTVESEDSGFLSLGVATVHTIHRPMLLEIGTHRIAEGELFALRTPNRFVVDRGGNFIVMVDRAGITRVGLFSGYVQICYPQGTTTEDRYFWPDHSTWACVRVGEDREIRAIFGTDQGPLIAAMFDPKRDHQTKSAGGLTWIEKRRGGQDAEEPMPDKGLP